MDKWLTLVPAYNRDYKTAPDVLIAWEKGLDFQIQDISCRYNGRYLNRMDAESSAYPELKETTFKVRYDGLVEFVLLQWHEDRWAIWNGEEDCNEEEMEPTWDSLHPEGL